MPEVNVLCPVPPFATVRADESESALSLPKLDEAVAPNFACRAEKMVDDACWMLVM